MNRVGDLQNTDFSHQGARTLCVFQFFPKNHVKLKNLVQMRAPRPASSLKMPLQRII